MKSGGRIEPQRSEKETTYEGLEQNPRTEAQIAQDDERYIGTHFYLSRTTSFGFLSSRRAMNRECRR